MPMSASPFSARRGLLDTRNVVTAAAVLAAHATGERDGMAPADVRFFILLFSNWLEADVLSPGHDVDLTQIRRALAHLVAQRWARARKSASATRSLRHWLEPEGIIGLAELVADPAHHRSLEDSLFAFTFAVTYRDAIVGRITTDPRRLDASTARKLRRILDPGRILDGAHAQLLRLRSDLVQRSEEGRRLLVVAGDARRERLDHAATITRLEKASPYQLQQVRTMRELFAALPSDLLARELESGIEDRIDWMFEPLAERAKSDLALLERLGRRWRAKKRS